MASENCDTSSAVNLMAGSVHWGSYAYLLLVIMGLFTLPYESAPVLERIRVKDTALA